MGPIGSFIPSIRNYKYVLCKSQKIKYLILNSNFSKKKNGAYTIKFWRVKRTRLHGAACQKTRNLNIRAGENSPVDRRWGGGGSKYRSQTKQTCWPARYKTWHLTASTCGHSWTTVVRNNLFLKMFLRARCFVQCYRAHCVSALLIVWSWHRRFWAQTYLILYIHSICTRALFTYINVCMYVYKCMYVRT